MLFFEVLRRQQDRPGREMLQGKGGILKGGVAIGLGEVPRVIGLGKEAEVGQFQISDHSLLLLKPGLIGVDLVERMSQEENQDNSLGQYEKEEFFGLAHGIQSSVFIRAGVTSLNLIIDFPLWSVKNSLAASSLAKGINSRPMGPYTSLPRT